MEKSFIPQKISSICRVATKYWLQALTLLGLIVALSVMIFSESLEKAAAVGEFISGFAAALAFLWLIASFRLQSDELNLQREELRTQRIAIQEQAKELRNASKFSSLSQISQILNRAVDKISSSELNVKSPSDLSALFTGGMAGWKTMLESRNAQNVFDEYTRWMKIEGLVRGYISSVAMAIKIYLEYYLQVDFDRSQNDEEFVYVNQVWMNKAPYLVEHSGSAYMLANFLFMYQPGLKAIQLAGFAASSEVLGKDLLKEGALEKLKKELTDKGTPLPKIAQ